MLKFLKEKSLKRKKLLAQSVSWSWDQEIKKIEFLTHSQLFSSALMLKKLNAFWEMTRHRTKSLKMMRAKLEVQRSC